jgi:carbon-monoxide dehydrogenase medium subunit
VAAQHFFVDIFSTALAPDEILACIRIPRPKPGMRFIYRKIRHPASGFAVVGIAVGVRLQQGVVAEISIGVTGAANHAFAGQHASDFLIGKTLSRDNIDQAAKLLSETTECLSDRYASAEYRANLIRVETSRALFALSS